LEAVSTVRPLPDRLPAALLIVIHMSPKVQGYCREFLTGLPHFLSPLALRGSVFILDTYTLWSNTVVA
jgi:hypothetical protein